jgi:hypothetical protein
MTLCERSESNYGIVAAMRGASVRLSSQCMITILIKTIFERSYVHCSLLDFTTRSGQ